MGTMGDALSRLFGNGHIGELTSNHPSTSQSHCNPLGAVGDGTCPLLPPCGADFFLNNYFTPNYNLAQLQTGIQSYSSPLNLSNVNLASLQQAICSLQHQHQHQQQQHQQQHQQQQQQHQQQHQQQQHQQQHQHQAALQGLTKSQSRPNQRVVQDPQDLSRTHVDPTNNQAPAKAYSSYNTNGLMPDLSPSNLVKGAYHNRVLEHTNSPSDTDSKVGRALRGSSEWCTPVKMDERHLSTSTPSYQESMSSRRQQSPFNSTDTSGISSDGSSSDGIVLMRQLDLVNPLKKSHAVMEKSPSPIQRQPITETRESHALQGRPQLESICEEGSKGNDGSISNRFVRGSIDEQSYLSLQNIQISSPNKSSPSPNGNDEGKSPLSNIDVAAKLHRHAAASNDATCTWSGTLPPRNYKSPNYSCKVFLGGVPWDITAAGLQHAFQEFGHVKIEFPGNSGTPRHPRYPMRGRSASDMNNPLCFGYVYAIFESDKQVKAMLQSCTKDHRNTGEYYFKISSRRMKSKDVQVIPWLISDSNYVVHNAQRLDSETTIFVGALHGMLNAEGLANVMNDLFGNVVYAGVDTDKYKYPIGSGRVTFCSHKSYMRAVNAAFVEIKTPKFVKKVQIDPYLEESICTECRMQIGPYFCRNQQCFKYYCKSCWQMQHNRMDASTGVHKPLTRNSKSNSTSAATFRQLPEIKAAEIKPEQLFIEKKICSSDSSE